METGPAGSRAGHRTPPGAGPGTECCREQWKSCMVKTNIQGTNKKFDRQNSGCYILNILTTYQKMFKNKIIPGING
jgi:hypothetical protein